MTLQPTTEAPVVLASRSPRRRELVRALDLDVRFLDPSADETAQIPGETAGGFVVRQSVDKATEVAAHLTDDTVVIGADTTVSLDGRLMGKPTGEDEATEMLRALRGREHMVVTGVTIMEAPSGRRLSGSKATTVRMRAYSDEEIAAYVASGEPMDKAGAYAVQDGTFRPAAEVSGCYLNVVGLPLCDVLRLLSDIGLGANLRGDWDVPPECRDCPLRDSPSLATSYKALDS